MASYRCSQCGTYWPQTGDYRRCPECEIPTWKSGARPISTEDAASRVNRVLFERYAREWEDRRAIEEENAISETVTARASGSCCLCGADIGSSWCHHPWSRPFDVWPEVLRQQLFAAAPYGFVPPPEKKA